jgi:hypothetical protein
MLALAAILILTVPSSGSSVSGRNATADAIMERSLALGIDFNAEDPKASHPNPEDAAALEAAHFGVWLDGQIQSPDDSIGEPPEALRDYLRDREASVGRSSRRSRRTLPSGGQTIRNETSALRSFRSSDCRDFSSRRQSSRSAREMPLRRPGRSKHRGP